MITQGRAEKLVKSRLAENLKIVDKWENDDFYIFELAIKTEDGKEKLLYGGNTVKVRKLDGSII